MNSIKTLLRYYEIFKRKKEEGKHNLNVATIFSYGVNEDDPEANGYTSFERDFDSVDFNVVAESAPEYVTHSREKLDECIEDYNQLYGTKFSTRDSQSFYNYYNDISKKLKDREKRPENGANRIDLLLVVNMFLTGFDAKKINTLFVDKNLKYHGLIQSYSRTNRIINETKSQGNIVVFRNLKSRTDKAIALFSNKDAIETIIMKPYEDYAHKFDEAFEKLEEITPTVDSVNELATEDDELEFIKAFRDLMRIKNVLATFSDFAWEGLQMSEQQFEDYKNKYLDLYEKVNSGPQKEAVFLWRLWVTGSPLLQHISVAILCIAGKRVLIIPQQQPNTRKILSRF